MRHRITVEKVSPYHRERPLGHYIREDEYGAEIFLAFEICPCHKESKKSAEDYRRNAGEKRDDDLFTGELSKTNLWIPLMNTLIVAFFSSVRTVFGDGFSSAPIL